MVLRRITEPKRENKQEAGRNSVKRGFIICVSYEILGDQSKED